MASASEQRKLPTSEQMNETAYAVYKASEAVGELFWSRLPATDLDPEGDDWEPITLAQLGELYATLAEVEAYAEEVGSNVQEFRDRLAATARLRCDQVARS